LGDKLIKEWGIDQSKRYFLKLGALSALANMFPRLGFADAHKTLSPKRTLSFYNVHTQESLEIKYWEKGKYLGASLRKINYIFRDYRADEIKTIDPRILDLLYCMRLKIRTHDPFHIVSAYRSPKTNAMLRRNGQGTAKNSYHMYGKAVDIRLPKFSLPFLRKIAMELHGGGVGYYARSNFVHVDTGPCRYWNGRA
jgi:uncharacterized protein YcbK (DUF882 family)